MSNQTSSIEWTDATWNPLVGWSRVSQGCVHCYAELMAARIANAAQEALRRGKKLTDIQAAYREVVRWEKGGMFAADEHDKALPKWNNEIRLLPSVLTDPLRWTKPRRVFVNSMTDLFHEKVPFDYVDKVFAVMALTPQHTYQVLTKRPERMAEYLNEPFRVGDYISAAIGNLNAEHMTDGEWWAADHDVPSWPLPNVWLGTSVEDQKAADERIPHLLRCPAAVRFLSCEPLIGGVEFSNVTHRSDCVQQLGKKALDGIHWVICGGESGPGARPMHPDWARSLRDQCVAAGVPFFFKQWGAWAWAAGGMHPPMRDDLCHRFEDGQWMCKFGKKAAGRILDGRTWDEFPEVKS